MLKFIAYRAKTHPQLHDRGWNHSITQKRGPSASSNLYFRPGSFLLHPDYITFSYGFHFLVPWRMCNFKGNSTSA